MILQTSSYSTKNTKIVTQMDPFFSPEEEVHSRLLRVVVWPKTLHRLVKISLVVPV